MKGLMVAPRKIVAIVLVFALATGAASPAAAQSAVKMRRFTGSVDVSASGPTPRLLEGTASHLGQFTARGEVEFTPTGLNGMLRGTGVIVFEAANGGTIFLDELGELPLGVQVKLLRVLENREIKRVGSPNATQIDIRVIAATNRDLEDMVTVGTFRGDLFYRLNVGAIHLPSLRAFLASLSEAQDSTPPAQ